MVKATYSYDRAAWIQLLELKGWTNTAVAAACGFTPEHVGNILDGTTLSARRDTKVKIRIGFLKLGATEDDIANLFK